MSQRLLFVYGTLMQGQRNHRALPPGATRIDVAWTRGRLYSVGDAFPAFEATDVEGELVRGELYAVTDFETTDMLEGYDADQPERLSHYLRRSVRVMTTGGATLTADVYIYNRSTLLLDRIDSGDWAVYERSLDNDTTTQGQYEDRRRID